MKFATLAVIAAAISLAVLSRPPSPLPRAGDAPLLPRAGFLHVLFGAQQQLIADYFWILTTHQIGATANAQDARDVYYYADLATDLDPDFRQVYWFAGVATVYPIARDKYANVRVSTKILQKGANRFPNDFKLHFQLAQNYLHFLNDHKTAAQLLARVAKFPDAPSWIASLATRLYAHSGEFDAGLELAKQMVETAPDEETRQLYELRLKEIRQERILRRLDQEIALFTDKEERRPKDIQELLAKGYAAGLPPDPLGAAYYIDEQDGRVKAWLGHQARPRLQLFTPKFDEQGK